MNAPQKTPVTPISNPGRYVLRMAKINPDYIQQSQFDQTVEYAFYFTDQSNHSLTYKCSAGRGDGKSLAILIGKFSGQYKQPISPSVSVEQFIDYCTPAVGKSVEVDVEIIGQGVGKKSGKPYFKYRLNFPKSATKPANDQQSEGGAIPF